ncbi:MAG: efflux RND transporter periplasmic adaptor subunit [Planctomycetes bacterium]|nr:efflux RND transporter periplasmic adaptor subunit [Planctomycetota bacterium]
MKRYFIISVIILLTAGGWFGWKKFLGANNGAMTFRTAKVERGDIVQTVNATGVVQPMQLIQVGTQVNGPVKKLYADFNSRVKEGDIVAQIDPALYDTNVAQSKANLARSEAGVEQIKANLALSEKELARAKELAGRDLISISELDTAMANRDSLLAQMKSAEASVDQSKSAMRTAQVNLDYTTIKSPVNGIVISRNVDEGQTVVTNNSAQVLFVIATDLKKIKIEAVIPEADIGKISEKQSVTFNVDAYPEREFSGSVVQVRLSSTTVQNVVTYTVIIHADNPDEKLLPGMTANLTFEVARKTQELKVPNAALRFVPDSGLVEEEPAVAGGTADAPKSEKQGMRKGNKGGARFGKLWVKTEKGKLKSVPVTIGISDGSFTEVSGKEVTEGMEIVTGTLEKGETAAANGTVNPFAPQRFPGGPRH